MKKIKEKPEQKIWDEFQRELKLTDEQLEKFKKYKELLSEWNESFNLTAIKDLSGIVRQHFEDSLALSKFVDLNEIKSIADVGTGAGFPALPLKIVFPHLNVFLIEVNHKKQQFLQEVVDFLGLENVEIVDLDWRTVLRKTEAEVDLFLTRAAVSDVELCRTFRQNCFYKNSKIVYWGTSEWIPHPKCKEFLKEVKEYKLGHKLRKLFFLYC